MTIFETIVTLPLVAIFALAWAMTRTIGPYTVLALLALFLSVLLWASAWWLLRESKSILAQSKEALDGAEAIADELDHRARQTYLDSLDQKRGDQL